MRGTGKTMQTIDRCLDLLVTLSESPNTSAWYVAANVENARTMCLAVTEEIQDDDDMMLGIRETFTDALHFENGSIFRFMAVEVARDKHEIPCYFEREGYEV